MPQSGQNYPESHNETQRMCKNNILFIIHIHNWLAQ